MKVDPRRISISAHPSHDFGPHSFDELMAEQLRHAPWVALSCAIHAVVIGLFMLMPTRTLVQEERAVRMEPPAVEEQTPELVEPEEEVLAEAPSEEPMLQDAEITENLPGEVTAENFSSAPGSALDVVDTSSWNVALGLGGGGASQGKFGRRGGGRRQLRSKGGRSTARAIELGLDWLKSHQDSDGRWDADDFMLRDPDGEVCDGPGSAVHDVGVTGLSLLAFLGDGSNLRTGPYREQVKKAVNWLRHQQGDDGLFGTDASRDYIYDHAIATLAIVEAYGLSDYKLLRRYAQRGIDYLENHRNSEMVWRYQPAAGANDTSITGWAVLAYKSAQDFGLRVNADALQRSVDWFDAVTDPETGVCGYTKRGEGSSRLSGDHQQRFPRERSEALTAVGLMCRFFLGQDPKQHPVMLRAAERLLAAPPVWDVGDGSIDHYYWYYGTYAMYQMGQPYWRDWSKHVTRAVVRTQRSDGPYEGSWDPVGVWGEDGGRVYATATLVLTLEAYYRYTRVLVR